MSCDATLDFGDFAQRDWTAWHRDRKTFGVWYVPVDEQMASFCRQVQADFADILYPDYQRQFHITVQAAGFVVAHKTAADELTVADVARQKHALQQQHYPAFKMQVQGMGMFLGSLHLQVACHETLMGIKQVLDMTHAEISPPKQYQPHITLGFFRGRYELRQLQQRLQDYPVAGDFWVREVVFGTYDPSCLQGQLTMREKVAL